MEIDSLVMSWNDLRNEYIITILTYKHGLITRYAKNITEAITVIDELEEEYAA